MKIRVGFGYDVHALASGENLVLGGVSIPHERGTVGHSDGDVLLHALADAMLGAVNSRDIGYHFPDDQDFTKNMDSTMILKHAMDIARKKGFYTGNIDCTIVAQKPRISGYIEAMQKKIAAVLEISPEDVAIKATTSEKLGFAGRQEGIAVYAVVLVEKPGMEDA